MIGIVWFWYIKRQPYCGSEQTKTKQYFKDLCKCILTITMITVMELFWAYPTMIKEGQFRNIVFGVSDFLSGYKCQIFCFDMLCVRFTGSSWSWSYDSWIYNYMCNQCLSPLTLWVRRILLKRGVFDQTSCDKVCQWLAASRWFSLDTRVSNTNKTNCHCIAEILLKLVLNTEFLTPCSLLYVWFCRLISSPWI